MVPTDLVYVTFWKNVVALDKTYGRTVWTWAVPKGAGYMALLVEDGTVFVSASGYMYALDAGTGKLRWSNELPGLGSGVPCLATTSARTVIGPLTASKQSSDSSSST